MNEIDLYLFVARGKSRWKGERLKVSGEVGIVGSARSFRRKGIWNLRREEQQEEGKKVCWGCGYMSMAERRLRAFVPGVFLFEIGSMVNQVRAEIGMVCQRDRKKGGE